MTCFLEFLLFVPYVSRVSSENPSWKSTSTACTMEKGPYHQGAEMTGLGILSPVVFAWIFHSPSGKAIWKLQQQKFTWLADFNCWFLVGGEDEDTMTLLKTAAIGYLTSNRTCRNLTTSSHPEENVQRKICGTGINGKAHFLQKKLFKLSAWIWGFAWLTWNWFSMWLLFVLVPDKLSSKVFNGTLMATQPAFAWSVFFTTGHTLLQLVSKRFAGWRLPMLPRISTHLRHSEKASWVSVATFRVESLLQTFWNVIWQTSIFVSVFDGW